MFDYIIVTPDCWKEIIRYLNEHSVPEEKIILGKVFKLPYFNLRKYLSIKKRRISIMSSNCLAGVVYEMLGFRVTTPTYNCFCKPDAFYSFMSNIDEHLTDSMVVYNQNLHGIIHDDRREFQYMPKGVLENHNEIVWYFNHTDDITKSVKYWNEKRDQVNRNDLFTIYYILEERHIELFNSMKPNKIGFSLIECSEDNIIYLKEWNESLRTRRINAFNFGVYIINQMTQGINVQCELDWISLLNGDKDYIRYR